MSKFKPIAAGALAATIVAAGIAVPGASAADPAGVGTAKTATTVLSVQLGDGSLLSLRVAGEDSQSTIDSAKAGAVSAFTRLSPLSLASNTASALNVALPVVEAKAPGGQTSVPPVSIPLSTPASTGSLSLATLSATVDGTSAQSGLGSSIDNLSLAGGLLAVPKATSNLSTSALATAADGVRGLSVPSVTVLDLGSLLDGLGLKLTDLPLSTITDLLKLLNIQVPGIVPTAELDAVVGQLNAAITQVNGLIATSGTGAVTQPVVDAVNQINQDLGGVLTPVAGLLGVRRTAQITIPTIPTVGATVDQLNDVLDTLKSTLTDLLGNALGVLDGAPLLAVNGLEVGLATKAADTVQNSTANVTAKIGSVVIGTRSVGGVDLAGAVSQVTGLVSSVTGALSTALGTIDPGLANLVTVSLFDQAKEVKAVDGYSTATARLTGLTATIKPPVDLGAIVSKVQAATGIGDVLGSLGVSLQALPTLSTAMSQLEAVLGTGIQALSQGAVLRVADLSSTSEYRPNVPPTSSTGGAPAPTGAPGSELPRTGADNATYAVLGVLLLALAAAIGRWLRRPINAL